jgi:hypothetical protein
LQVFSGPTQTCIWEWSVSYDNNPLSVKKHLSVASCKTKVNLWLTIHRGIVMLIVMRDWCVQEEVWGVAGQLVGLAFGVLLLASFLTLTWQTILKGPWWRFALMFPKICLLDKTLYLQITTALHLAKDQNTIPT